MFKSIIYFSIDFILFSKVEFDCSYVDLEEDLHRRSKGRQDQERDMQKAIVSILPSSGSDFDALTGLYRMIFAYVMNHFGRNHLY